MLNGYGPWVRKEFWADRGRDMRLDLSNKPWEVLGKRTQNLSWGPTRLRILGKLTGESRSRDHLLVALTCQMPQVPEAFPFLWESLTLGIVLHNVCATAPFSPRLDSLASLNFLVHRWMMFRVTCLMPITVGSLGHPPLALMYPVMTSDILLEGVSAAGIWSCYLLSRNLYPLGWVHQTAAIDWCQGEIKRLKGIVL